jgi:radical SAM protein with 4Fe4S-binding SPASM domain
MNPGLGFPMNPFELKIELTQACNLRCAFCYLGDTALWQRAEYMPEHEVLRWIDWAAENKIPAVRFTGGEATLHPKIKLFCNYAYLQKRWIILNTNAMAEARLYDELLAHDLRVSVPSLDATWLDEITGGTNVLQKKLALIERTLAAGKRHVCMLTVMTPELIGKLEAFARLLQASPGLMWVPLRYESSPSVPRPLTRAQMQALVEEMADLMDRYPDRVNGICIAAPFCAVTPTSLGARVFGGRIRDCGPYAALNVNFDGNLTACFGVCELFREGTLEDAKNSPKLHAVCSLDALPRECQTCEYVQRCGGGCRKPAGLVPHEGKYVDYLAGFVNP